MPVPSSITDLSTTASSNYPAGTELPSSLDDAIRAVSAIVKQNVSKGTDIASASSITIPASGSYFVVTGTTTITTIADSNAFNGREVNLKFSGALTLTHSSGLILPGAANITTAAGDVAKVAFESTGVWRCTEFLRAAVAPISQGIAAGDSPQFAGVNIGHASDTTLTRVSAGVIAVEGTALVKVGAATASGLTQAADRLLGRTTAGSGAIEEITVGSGLSLAAGALTATGSGITLGTPVASTSGTSIDFTSIPTGTKRITVMFAGVSTSGTSDLMIQLGDAGGIEATGYTGGASNQGGGQPATNSTGFIIAPQTDASGSREGAITLVRERSSDHTWTEFGVLGQNSGFDASGGRKTLSAELDRVRITTVGGTDTFDAGEINISYE